MPDRRDAFLAAAEIALAVERAALATGSRDTVGTTGVCHVFPGAVNSVPSEVLMEIDVRDIDPDRRDRVLRQLEAESIEICSRRRILRGWEVINADPPAQCAAEVVDALSAACENSGLPWMRMVSRAYHDSLFMSRIAPTAMLFVPCRGGVSHRPDEYASPQAIAAGAAVLARTLSALADRPD
jgi:N-carbamoyl-L-amino-acid hydrolase